MSGEQNPMCIAFVESEVVSILFRSKRTQRSDLQILLRWSEKTGLDLFLPPLEESCMRKPITEFEIDSLNYLNTSLL